MSLPDWFVNRIKQHEGFKTNAYRDGSQYSIGWGTRAKSPTETIDQAEGNRRLLVELADARRQVEGIVRPDAPDNVKLALTSLTHNAGNKWMNSGLGDLVRQGDYPAAAARMQLYVKSGGRTLGGLVTRRGAEADLMMGREQPGGTAQASAAPGVNPQTTPAANWPGSQTTAAAAPAQPQPGQVQAPAASPPRPPANVQGLSIDGLPIATAYSPGQAFGRSATAGAQPFTAIVAHHTGGTTLAGALQTARGDPSRGGVPYGYHIVIDTDGSVHQTAPLDARTNHVEGPFGVNRSSRPDISNKNAIGVSFVGQGEPTPAQMASWQKIYPALQQQYNIPTENIVGHGEIQSGSRSPGEAMAFVKAARSGAAPTTATAAAPAAAVPVQTASAAPTRTAATSSPFPPPPGAPANWSPTGATPTDTSAVRRQPAAAPRAPAPDVIRMHSGSESGGGGQPMGQLLAAVAKAPSGRSARAQAPASALPAAAAPPSMPPEFNPANLEKLGLMPETGNVKSTPYGETGTVKPGDYLPLSPLSSEMGSVMPPGQMDWTDSVYPMRGATSPTLNGPVPPTLNGPVPTAPEIAGNLTVPFDRLVPPGGMLAHSVEPGPSSPPPLSLPPFQAPRLPLLSDAQRSDVKQRIGLSQYGPEGRVPPQQPPMAPPPWNVEQAQLPLSPLAVQSQMPQQQGYAPGFGPTQQTTQQQVPMVPPEIAFMPGQNWWEMPGMSGGLSPFAGFSGGGSFGGEGFSGYGGGGGW